MYTYLIFITILIHPPPPPPHPKISLHLIRAYLPLSLFLVRPPSLAESALGLPCVAGKLLPWLQHNLQCIHSYILLTCRYRTFPPTESRVRYKPRNDDKNREMTIILGSGFLYRTELNRQAQLKVHLSDWCQTSLEIFGEFFFPNSNGNMTKTLESSTSNMKQFRLGQSDERV